MEEKKEVDPQETLREVKKLLSELNSLLGINQDEKDN